MDCSDRGRGGGGSGLENSHLSNLHNKITENRPWRNIAFIHELDVDSYASSLF